MPTSNMVARVSDTAVRAKTCHDWAAWFAILDRAGARKMSHAAIARYLRAERGCSPWWSQMVAVGYEQARGLREKHETPTGYQISVSRTMAGSSAALYDAWDDQRVRQRWLQSEFTMRKGRPGKSLRITWADATHVDVDFYAKNTGKTQVVVQHRKLRSAAGAVRMKRYWAVALDRLAKLAVVPVEAARRRPAKARPVRRRSRNRAGS